MADHFLIHQSHKYEEEARREEVRHSVAVHIFTTLTSVSSQRKYNRKLYADFKEEACLRYLYRFHAAGLLHDPISSNAIEQCRRMKNIEKLVSEVSVTYSSMS